MNTKIFLKLAFKTLQKKNNKKDLNISIFMTCLYSVVRLFYNFAPFNENNFCTLEDLFTGSFKSVAVRRRLYIVNWEFFCV